jgi:hypothetical protein
MGGTGHWLRVDGSGDLEGLHEAIWDFTERCAYGYLRAPEYEETVRYAQGNATAERQRGSWGARDGVLRYMFGDFAGHCGTSMKAWSHWTALVWASRWESLEHLARDRGFEILDSRPSLAPLLHAPGLVVLRGAVWEPCHDELLGDGVTLSVSELDDTERRGVAEAGLRCQCAMCAGLRPDEHVYRAWRDLLACHEWSDDLELVPDHLLHALRTQDPTSAGEILRDVVRDAGGDDAERVVSDLATRVPAWATLGPELPTLTGRALALARMALARRPDEEIDRDAWLAMNRARLAPGDSEDAWNAMLELHARMRGSSACLEEVSAMLDWDLGSEESRIQVVEVLSDLRAPGTALPPVVRARLEREVGRGEPSAECATELLATT